MNNSAHKTKAIILDFDHTLFNTTLYVEALRDKLVREDVMPEELQREKIEHSQIAGLSKIIITRDGKDVAMKEIVVRYEEI